MDYSLLIAIGVTIVASILSLVAFKLYFKESIIYIIAVYMSVPIGSVCMLGYIVGAKGIIHAAWLVPLALVICFTIYHFLGKWLKSNLNGMYQQVSALSEGDVQIVFDEKSLEGKHEIAVLFKLLEKLTLSLQTISKFAGHIGKGDLSTEYQVLGKRDILGQSILEMRENLVAAEKENQKRYKEDEQRNWITLGLAKFAEILRKDNDNLKELSYSIISNLVKYVGVNQGGIFIVNDQDRQHPFLELNACYAYDRHKYVEKRIEPGEGLVGACFLERESIYMTNIPQNYMHITSGLGDDNPRALLIVPLQLNEVIYGVVEIASFKPLEPFEREFIERVAESIASTISTVKINIQTNQLLQTSKLQAEEMASQEEELRQNLEELQATQEELGRKQSEADKVQKDFSESLPYFTVSEDWKIVFVSNTLAGKLRCTPQELIGKHFDDVFSMDKNKQHILSGEVNKGFLEKNGDKTAFYASLMGNSNQVIFMYLM